MIAVLVRCNSSMRLASSGRLLKHANRVALLASIKIHNNFRLQSDAYAARCRTSLP